MSDRNTDTITSVARWLREGAGTPPPAPPRRKRATPTPAQRKESTAMAPRKRSTLHELASESRKTQETETESAADAGPGTTSEPQTEETVDAGNGGPTETQHGDEEERVRMTLYLPLSAWEVVEETALARKKARGGKGHASASAVVADLVERHIGELEAEVAKGRRPRR